VLTTTRAVITCIERVEAGVIVAQAEAEGTQHRVLAYPPLTGSLAVGDTVLLNTTATMLHLGTGGYDFVIANLSTPCPTQTDDTGHIVKLRYTPHQHAVNAAEMHQSLPATLLGKPVVVCGLHSQIAAVAAGVIAENTTARIAYVMTDAAALPLAFSNLVRDLKERGWLHTTITAGQAFGGDHEAVTVPSALLLAAALSDVVIVSQGPGNAGTGTTYGFSGIEQTWWLDIVGALRGKAIGVLRLSEADPRLRHRGLSHHSQTVFGKLTARRATLALPACCPVDLLPEIHTLPHEVVTVDTTPGWERLLTSGIPVTTMGRRPTEDALFFHAGIAAGVVAGTQATTVRSSTH
jgi:hypothetical protein